jgi:tetratricopeptide (TPR) repeat protein
MGNIQDQLLDLFLRADDLIKDNCISEAINILNEITEKDPGFGRAYNHLGFIYETKYQDFKKADEYYRMSLEKAPDYLPGYYNYAVLLSTLKRYDELKSHLEKALEKPGINKGSIFTEFGIMYEAQGEYDKAIEMFKEAIKNLFDSKIIETTVGSINRCKQKKDILN